MSRGGKLVDVKDDWVTMGDGLLTEVRDRLLATLIIYLTTPWWNLDLLRAINMMV